MMEIFFIAGLASKYYLINNLYMSDSQIKNFELNNLIRSLNIKYIVAVFLFIRYNNKLYIKIY